MSCLIGVLVSLELYGWAALVFSFNVFDYLIDLREKS